MSKKIILSSIFLAFLTILFFSCRKDIDTFFEETEMDANNLIQAKIFLAKKTALVTGLKQEKLMSVLPSSKPRQLIKLAPQWKKSRLVSRNNKSILIVPTMENKLSTVKLSIQRFFIFKMKGDVVEDGNIVEIINEQPSSEPNLEQILTGFENGVLSDFTGGILIYDLNYFYLKSKFFKNGEKANRIGQIKSFDSDGSGATVKSNSSQSTYSQHCTNYYLNTTYYYSDGTVANETSEYLYTVCSSIPSGCTVDCSPTQSGGGGSYGGNENVSVHNNVINTCTKSAVAKALYTGAPTEIASMLFSTFTNVPNKILELNDIVLPDTDRRDAVTTTSYVNGIQKSTIKFNSATFNKRSDQYNVATVYHEVLHAQLRAMMPTAPDGTILIAPQHEYMASNYVTMLTSALTSQFLGITFTEARALAWGGLKGTTMWNLLSQNEKQAIDVINTLYSDKDRADRLGDYCN